MRHQYRCTRSKCRKRYSFHKPIDEYATDRLCSCGGELKHDPEPHIRAKRDRCNCDGYHFPHRRGSLWCNHFEGERIEDDYNDRYQQGKY